MRTILVTGATGVIGSALVPRLLADRDVQLRLLIRADGDAHRVARLAELRAFWESDVSDEQFPRITALAGDVCEPRLGLGSEAYSRLAGDVTHVVHAAGNVKLNLSLTEARRYAVGGLQNVVALCHTARRTGQFQKLDYLSTVGVAGRMPGLIPERRLTEPRAFHNSYEQGKSEAEEYLFAEMDRGLAATIHRPSMVVGDSRTGKLIRPQVFHHLCDLLSGRRTCGIVPNLAGARLDLVPVDCVADMICISTASDDCRGRVFHLCAGPGGAIDLSSLSRLARQHLSSQGMPLPKLRTVPLTLAVGCMPIIKLLARSERWRACRALPPLLRYLATRRSQDFDNRETVRYFSEWGVRISPADACFPNAFSKRPSEGESRSSTNSRSTGCRQQFAEATP